MSAGVLSAARSPAAAAEACVQLEAAAIGAQARMLAMKTEFARLVTEASAARRAADEARQQLATVLGQQARQRAQDAAALPSLRTDARAVVA